MLLSISLFANSQVVQEKSYEGSAAVAQLETEGYKFVVTDAINDKCVLYNTDHSLWKFIDVPVPENNFIADISYVSQHLFNDDDDIEFLVVYAKYITSGEFSYYEYTTSIVGESGDTILVVDGGGYAFIQEIDDDDAKLFVYVYDFSSSSLPVSTEVFDIPGHPMSIQEGNNSEYKSVGNPFPNPAGSYINIPYSLDESDETGLLIINDVSGKEVRRYQIGQKFDNIKVLTSGLPGGVYFYRVGGEHTKSVAKKFVVR